MSTSSYPTRNEVCDLLRAHYRAKGKEALWVGQGSAQSDYGDALNAGLITREQYDAARARGGNLWNYAGD